MTGPETSSIALTVASFGDMPCSMWCSTASTTTIASSTTSPIARIRPNKRKRVDGEAQHRKDGERADQRYRHGDQRNQRRAPTLQKQEDDDDDEHDRFQQGRARSLSCLR